MISNRLNKFAYLHKPGALEIIEEPLPDNLPGPDYVRLKLAYCGLCGSDLAFIKGRKGAAYPRSLGHEQIGKVIEKGGKVNGIEVGSWVVVDPNTRCGECRYCLAGASHHCERSEVALFHPRGLAKYQDIHHSYLHPLPKFNPIYIGALAEPLSCALHAVERAQISADDNVLILGAGSMGSMAAFALLNKFDGLEITMHDAIPERLDRFMRYFPGRVDSFIADDLQDKFAVVFEVTGDPNLFRLAAQSVAKQGRIVVISRYRNRDIIELPTNLCRQEIDIKFSHLNGNGETAHEAIALLKQNGAQDYLELIEIHPLDQLHIAIQRMQSSSYCKTMIEIDGSME